MRPDIYQQLEKNLLSQVKDILTIVKVLLPAFYLKKEKEGSCHYRDLLFQVHSYSRPSTTIRDKYIAIQFCMQWVKLAHSQAYLWEESLYNSLMKIDENI